MQDKWDDLEYAREAVYGIVATCAMGHMVDIVEFRVPSMQRMLTTVKNIAKHFQWSMPVITSCMLQEHLVCMAPASLHFHHATNV